MKSYKKGTVVSGPPPPHRYATFEILEYWCPRGCIDLLPATSREWQYRIKSGRGKVSYRISKDMTASAMTKYTLRGERTDCEEFNRIMMSKM